MYMKEEKDIRRHRFTNYGVAMINRSLESIDKLKRFSERANYIIKEEEFSLILTTLRSKIDELEDHYFKKQDDSIVFTLEPKDSASKEDKGINQNTKSYVTEDKGYYEEIDRLSNRLQNLEKEYENTKKKVIELSHILKLE